MRVAGNSGRVTREAQGVLQEFMPDAPSIRVQPAESLFDRWLRPRRLGATLFTSFGLIALGLGILGVYSVMAYLVAQRRRGLAVRTALGATVGDNARLVLGEVLRITTLSVAIGLAASLLMARGVRALQFGISPLNPTVYVAAALVLGAAALTATAIPVRQAAATSPASALREE